MLFELILINKLNSKLLLFQLQLSFILFINLKIVDLFTKCGMQLPVLSWTLI